jgi:hypothetical protein
MESIKQSIRTLSELLRRRNNSAHQFFDAVLIEIDTDPKSALDKIKTCYSIVQYADFNSSEENLLDEIILSVNKFQG